MDLTDSDDMDAFEGVLKELKPNIRMLFQSAGEGLHQRFDEMNRAEAKNMLRLNCEALTNMTSICLPYMKAGSRIIQIASSAAYVH